MRFWGCDMRKTVEKMIRTWGTEVKVVHEGLATMTTAIFMPTTSRSWQNMQDVYSPLGETPRGQYNYISALEPLVEKGDKLYVGDKAYRVRRAEVIRDAKGPLYRWGLCVESGGLDFWGDIV